MSQTPACPDVPSDEPAHIDLLRGEIGAALGFGDEPVTNEQEQNVEAVLRVVQRHYRILADRASRALPSTALAARPEEGWQIKPLEWEHHPQASGQVRATTSIGTYRIVGFSDYSLWGCLAVSKSLMNTAESVEAAKAAAQADYETRIRSALIAPSTPPTAGDGHEPR